MRKLMFGLLFFMLFVPATAQSGIDHATVQAVVAQPATPAEPAAEPDAAPADEAKSDEAQADEAKDPKDALGPIADGEAPAQGEEGAFLVKAVKWIYMKFQAKEYGPAVACILMLIVAFLQWLLRKQGKKIRKKWTPWVVIVTATLGGAALGMVGIEPGAGWTAWLGAAGAGLGTGLGAIGAWELIGKKLLSKWTQTDKEKEADEAKAKVLNGGG